MGSLVFAVIIWGVLYASDVVLSIYLPEYEQSGEYGVALIIFFLFAAVFLLFGQVRGWDNWRYFIISPIAIFLPLVFIATSFRYAFGLENAFTSYHTALHCGAGEGMCGKAFAYVFFSMSLRSVPTVFLVPPIYWFVNRAMFPAKTVSKT